MILSLFFIISLIISGFLIIANKWHKREPLFALSVVGISLVLSLICWIGIHFGNSARMMFKEVWNYKINKVAYYEEWDETVPCQHPIYQTITHTYTDSKGQTYTETETIIVGYEHPFDVDTHPPRWIAIDEYESSHKIDRQEYNKWKNIWGNNHFQDMHRDYYSEDGDMYYSVWDNQFNTIYPWEEIKLYQNKIRVAKSVFNFAEVSKEIAKRYQRPADNSNGNPILTYGISVTENDQILFKRLNASLGKQYKIHNIVMLFDYSKYPISEVENIKNAWKGANKNELVTCIGLSSNNHIEWCDVFSWMDDTTIHSMIRQDVVELKTYDNNQLFYILNKRIPQYWVKKDFRDFDYLRVEIPFSYIIGGVITLVILNIGLIIGSVYYYRENY